MANGRHRRGTPARSPLRPDAAVLFVAGAAVLAVTAGTVAHASAGTAAPAQELRTATDAAPAVLVAPLQDAPRPASRRAALADDRVRRAVAAEARAELAAKNARVKAAAAHAAVLEAAAEAAESRATARAIARAVAPAKARAAAAEQARAAAEAKARALIAATARATAAPTATGLGGVQLPVTGYTLTAGFGEPGDLWAQDHTGLDFACPAGTFVRAVADGTVVSAGWAGAYGWRTIVRHADGTETWYAHQFAQLVRAGQVKAGEILGVVGSTGNATGPHLHFEVRVGGVAVDPALWLAAQGVAS